MNNIIDIFWNINFCVDTYLHSLILFTILSFFFMLYISKIKASTFGDKINEVIDTDMTDIIKDIKSDTVSTYNIVDKIDKIISKPYALTETNNEGLFNLIIILNIILWSFFIILLLVLKQCYCLIKIDMLAILIDGLFIFLYITIIQYLFFKKIELNYDALLPSFISRHFFDNIKKKFALSNV